jgi:hypothetical protein
MSATGIATPSSKNGDGTLRSSGAAGTVGPKLALNIPGNAPVIATDLNGDGLADLIAGNVEFLSTIASGGGSSVFADGELIRVFTAMAPRQGLGDRRVRDDPVRRLATSPDIRAAPAT